MICTQCRKAITDQNAFCTNCGAPTESNAPAGMRNPQTAHQSGSFQRKTSSKKGWKGIVILAVVALVLWVLGSVAWQFLQFAQRSGRAQMSQQAVTGTCVTELNGYYHCAPDRVDSTGAKIELRQCRSIEVVPCWQTATGIGFDKLLPEKWSTEVSVALPDNVPGPSAKLWVEFDCYEAGLNVIEKLPLLRCPQDEDGEYAGGPFRKLRVQFEHSPVFGAQGKWTCKFASENDLWCLEQSHAAAPPQKAAVSSPEDQNQSQNRVQQSCSSASAPIPITRMDDEQGVPLPQFCNGKFISEKPVSEIGGVSYSVGNDLSLPSSWRHYADPKSYVLLKIDDRWWVVTGHDSTGHDQHLWTPRAYSELSGGVISLGLQGQWWKNSGDSSISLFRDACESGVKFVEFTSSPTNQVYMRGPIACRDIQAPPVSRESVTAAPQPVSSSMQTSSAVRSLTDSIPASTPVQKPQSQYNFHTSRTEHLVFPSQSDIKTAPHTVLLGKKNGKSCFVGLFKVGSDFWFDIYEGTRGSDKSTDYYSYSALQEEGLGNLYLGPDGYWVGNNKRVGILDPMIPQACRSGIQILVDEGNSSKNACTTQ